MSGPNSPTHNFTSIALSTPLALFSIIPLRANIIMVIRLNDPA
jgi:hypothetical protein